MAAATGGRRGCKLDCKHRRFVLDYIAERDAQELRAEAYSGGNATERAEFYDRLAGVEHRLTFRAYLETRAGADYPYPAGPMLRRPIPRWPECELAA